MVASVPAYNNVVYTYVRMCVNIYVAKDPDTIQTVLDDSTTTSRVCVNLGAADEEDSDDLMHDSDNGQYTHYVSLGVHM